MRTYDKGLTLCVPTLMAASTEALYYTTKVAIDHPKVAQIIVMDNSEEELFRKWSHVTGIGVHKHPKVQVINNKVNNYVNPSWNQGMAASKGENTIIVNDDVFVCGEVIDQVAKCMKDNVLCSVDTVNAYDEKEYTHGYNYHGFGTFSTNEKFSQSNNNKCGWFFCVRNSIWRDIPKELKYFYGDDLIFDRARALGYVPKCITSCSIGHMGSVTVNQNPDIQTILRKEFEIYKRVKQEYITP